MQLNKEGLMYKLSICIPTYNRSKYLSICLEHLLPQVEGKENVEVVIVDNASSDDTTCVVADYQKKCKNTRYYRNKHNFGYSGNQLKCFEYANGKYLAILSDDDVYTDNLVDDILDVIKKCNYSFIALNYYGFVNDVNKPYNRNFAPINNVCFDRAYDILNYPSVGHFSGFIFNKELAKATLKKILETKNIGDFEKYRGIITDIAHRSLSETKLPSYFLGKRKLANRIPIEVDYDSIHHLCLEYYEYFYSLFQEGIIETKDLEYRKRLVLSGLPRAIVVDSYKLSNLELKNITTQLLSYFKNDKRFYLISLPLLYLVRVGLIKYILKQAHAIIHNLKLKKMQSES